MLGHGTLRYFNWHTVLHWKSLETSLFPKEEIYSLTDQIRRASRSVAANLAEAHRKRRYRNAFVLKISDADAEATEVQVWLDFANDFGYLSVTNTQSSRQNTKNSEECWAVS